MNDFEIIESLIHKLDGSEIDGKFIHARYGTVEEYFTMIWDFEFPSYSGDFLPYEEWVLKLHPMTDRGLQLDYWTGFFSQRPVMKF